MAHHYGDFMKKPKYIVVSGGFDPVHIGHVRMFKEASKYGLLLVVLNSDEWLQRKKGYAFMPFEERAEIIRSFKGVHDVVYVDDKDNTVCEAIQRIKPKYFANGGDRTDKNTPEMKLCEKLNIKLLWNVGGEKIQSSSELVFNVEEREAPPSEQQMVDPFDIFEVHPYDKQNIKNA
jgi:cytidyltransferase-like protein